MKDEAITNENDFWLRFVILQRFLRGSQVMMKVESTTVEPVRPREDVTENEVEVTPSSAIPTGKSNVELTS